MKKYFLVLLICMFTGTVFSQPIATDSVIRGTVSIVKDERIDLLGKKMTEYNESLANKIHLVKGYRLMLLSTTDRTRAMEVRSQLMQQFPEHNVYMTFQSPYIRLKFGNFIEKDDAEKMRKTLVQAKLITGNIYVVPEMVEMKPDKTKVLSTEEQ